MTTTCQRTVKPTERVEVHEAPMVWTDYGWALASLTPPWRCDLFWVKMPERHVYTWDGDGWYRIDPPEMVRYNDGMLPHP